MATEKTDSKEVAKTGYQLPALPDEATFKEIVEDNLEGITASFPVIKIPTGGGTIWSVPSEGEDEDMVKELQGVILDHYAVRVYWRENYGQGVKQPPTCSSLTARTGSQARQNGEFGECASCKWAQFGTAVKQDGSQGRGQACSFRHRVFLLMPDRSLFPYLINLSTMSTTNYAGSLNTFAVAQTAKFRKLSGIVSKVKLVKDKNADQTEYAKAQFFFVAELSPEEKTKVAGLKKMFASAMREKPIEVEEAEETPVTEHRSGPMDGTPDPWS